MHDLTQGSITRHLLGMAGFIAMGMVFQTLYFLVDLYFVSRLGSDAVAGLSTGGVVFFAAMALSNVVAVGGLSLLSHAAGRKDPQDGDRVFNQALLMSLALAAATLLIGYGFAGPAMRALAADAAAARAAHAYLMAFLPALAMMFPSAALGSALRAVGVVRPTMLIQTLGVLLNAVLAPILIAGWGTGAPLGVFGAGLASTIAGAAALGATIAIFPRVQTFLRAHAGALRPHWPTWGRIAGIGLPTAGEFFLMFFIFTVIYGVIRDFGAEAQAGFGIGGRIMQAVFLPAMSVAFACAPVAGQNMGAGLFARVRETFAKAAWISVGVMGVTMLLLMWRADVFVAPFTHDPDVLAVAVTYLRIIALNFIATGFIFVCSGMFQALGDTRPAFLSSATRLATFVVPAIWMSAQPWMEIEHVWWLAVASVTLQAGVSWLLLRRLMAKKLASPETA